MKNYKNVLVPTSIAILYMNRPTSEYPESTSETPPPGNSTLRREILMVSLMVHLYLHACPMYAYTPPIFSDSSFPGAPNISSAPSYNTASTSKLGRGLGMRSSYPDLSLIPRLRGRRKTSLSSRFKTTGYEATQAMWEEGERVWY